MRERAEQFLLTNGTGRIEVRSTGHACGLFLDGKPFAHCWPDCGGSIGQDLYRFAVPAEGAMLPDLAEIVAQAPSQKRSLAEQIAPLLRQFPPGSYQLVLSPLKEGDIWDDYSVGNGIAAKDFDRYPYAWDYPDYNRQLITTQPYDGLDDERILHFWYAIEQGDRPFAITASVTDAKYEFVLDGHHKLAAYAYAGIAPWRLCISTDSPKPLLHTDWPAAVKVMPSWLAYHEYQHGLTEEQQRVVDAAQSYYDQWVRAIRE